MLIDTVPVSLRSQRIPLTVIPQGFYVTYGRAKVAHGAVKPRNTGGGGAKPTGEVTAKGNTRWKYTNALRAHGK